MSDHGGEFISDLFKTLYIYIYIYIYKGYHHNFSTLRTPSQNTIVERKN
jgi:hypothetical protein